ncbi:hypothetical protein M413DRAFT_250864 [Hebeloma cylindrosporum]|uniref:Uncharacterized protein n=1 Tax=Hebeloma cylindrosporum TaxID=76867 RepID=A0A0C3BNA2_HEBCY|nr:hypothetical protein M413DRAFT_250864 [Hebeloma cylindrosporum h7]
MAATSSGASSWEEVLRQLEFRETLTPCSHPEYFECVHDIWISFTYYNTIYRRPAVARPFTYSIPYIDVPPSLSPVTTLPNPFYPVSDGGKYGLHCCPSSDTTYRRPAIARPFTYSNTIYRLPAIAIPRDHTFDPVATAESLDRSAVQVLTPCIDVPPSPHRLPAITIPHDHAFQPLLLFWRLPVVARSMDSSAGWRAQVLTPYINVPPSPRPFVSKSRMKVPYRLPAVAVAISQTGGPSCDTTYLRPAMSFILPTRHEV